MDTKEIINRLGGTTKAAEFFEITPGAVSQWIVNGIPKDKLRILRSERPDIFDPPTSRRRKTYNSTTKEK